MTATDTQTTTTAATIAAEATPVIEAGAQATETAASAEATPATTAPKAVVKKSKSAAKAPKRLKVSQEAIEAAEEAKAEAAAKAEAEAKAAAEAAAKTKAPAKAPAKAKAKAAGVKTAPKAPGKAAAKPAPKAAKAAPKAAKAAAKVSEEDAPALDENNTKAITKAMQAWKPDERFALAGSFKRYSEEGSEYVKNGKTHTTPWVDVAKVEIFTVAEGPLKGQRALKFHGTKEELYQALLAGRNSKYKDVLFTFFVNKGFWAEVQAILGKGCIVYIEMRGPGKDEAGYLTQESVPAFYMGRRDGKYVARLLGSKSEEPNTEMMERAIDAISYEIDNEESGIHLRGMISNTGILAKMKAGEFDADAEVEAAAAPKTAAAQLRLPEQKRRWNNGGQSKGTSQGNGRWNNRGRSNGQSTSTSQRQGNGRWSNRTQSQSSTSNGEGSGNRTARQGARPSGRKTQTVVKSNPTRRF